MRMRHNARLQHLVCAVCIINALYTCVSRFARTKACSLLSYSVLTPVIDLVYRFIEPLQNESYTNEGQLLQV